MRKKQRIIKPILVYSCFALLVVILFPVSILAGYNGGTSIWEVVSGIFSRNNFTVNTLIRVNMPRTLIALFSGFALGAAGVMFQSVTRNRLADPSIIGVSSSSYAVVLFISLSFPLLTAFASLFAAIFSFCVFILIFFLSYSGGLKSNKILAVGAAVNAIFVTIILTIAVMKGLGAGNILLSSVGSLGVPESDVVLVSVIIISISLFAALLMCGKCNILALGDKTAHSLGTNVLLSKIMLAFIGTVLTAAAAANVGLTAFLGLLAPMIARNILGKNHFHVLPLSALIGGILLVVSDCAGRSLNTPVTLPVGIITTIVGGIAFLFIFARRLEYAA